MLALPHAASLGKAFGPAGQVAAVGGEVIQLVSASFDLRRFERRDGEVLMADDNLTTIPVVDYRRRILGLITVDDVLETTLPGDWRQRRWEQQ